MLVLYTEINVYKSQGKHTKTIYVLKDRLSKLSPIQHVSFPYQYQVSEFSTSSIAHYSQVGVDVAEIYDYRAAYGVVYVPHIIGIEKNNM